MKKKESLSSHVILVVILIGVLLVGVGLIYLVFQRKDVDQDMISSKEAYEIIVEAEELTFTGDGDAMTQKPTVWAGEQQVGKLVDKGIIHRQIQLFAGDELMMYLQSDNTELPNTSAGPTYAFFDSQDTCIGYTKETLESLINAPERDYIFTFYDKDKNKKDYYAYDDDEGWKIYDQAGKVLLEGYYDYNHRNSEYAIRVITYDNQVDQEDKLLVYFVLLQNVSSNFPEGS